ncbi:hypothetical protein LDO51_04110 [Providencia alcalifaciens]|uniref:hypothetical protein n=1 Tax=Providencia alcalifaciens TaxID=126385 RepID=UPI001CE0C4A4|nr:hypothetical protein LDO51_04110 [Providencia alcalifaciens]
MSLVEKDDPENNGKIIPIPSSRELDLKIKMYQEAYHHITGKNEKTSFRSSADLHIDMNELNQIHHKISQICDVHNIIAQSESITVIHSKERKEQFTSFDRFKIYNNGITSPTLTVLMEYNFSILPNGSINPQQYKLTIRLNSRIALIQQMKEDAPPFIRSNLIRFMYGPTADISVEYVDYVIARSFIEAMQEWVDGCKKTKNKLKFLQYFQGISHLFPSIISFANGILLTYFFIKNIPEVLNEKSSYLDVLQYGILFFSSFMLMSKIASFFGGLLESSIDRYIPISYLSLNQGDKRIINDYHDEKSNNIFSLIFSISLTISLGVVSSLIASLILVK